MFIGGLSWQTSPGMFTFSDIDFFKAERVQTRWRQNTKVHSPNEETKIKTAKTFNDAEV